MFRDPNTRFTVVLYVDDILTRGSTGQTKEFHAALGAKFDCKPESYLAIDNALDLIGFSITQIEEDGERCVYLDQQQQLD